MLYFEVNGILKETSIFDECENRVEDRKKKRRISLNSREFNQIFNNNSKFFISDVRDNFLTVGVIASTYEIVEKGLKLYFKHMEMKVDDISFQEIAFEKLDDLISDSCFNNYIDNENEIRNYYKFNMIYERHGRNIDMDEGLIEECSEEEIINKADNCLMKDCMISEINRIYAGKKSSSVLGHPVHYIVQTDDNDIRKSVCNMLLQSLYSNKRILSKRYCNLSFKSGSGFSKKLYDNLYKNCYGGAIIVNYNANDDSEDNGLASCDNEIIEQVCEMVKQYRNQVLTLICLPRTCNKAKNVFYENLGTMSMVELREDFVDSQRGKEYLKMLAKENNIRTNKKLFTSLEDDKTYLANELHLIFDEWYGNQLRTSVYPQYKDMSVAKRETQKAAPLGTAYDELQKMTGLTEAKKVIQKALNFYKVQKLYEDRGMKKDQPAMHMIFTGNPGTAKTTVARLFARIMKDNGLLSTGQLVEVGRGDLVGRYVGWTAKSVKSKFQESKGGVLFIDEAYSLVDDRDGSFGDEAINTIVQEMENHRDDVIVIFAGYPDKMEGFMDKNPGLRSRIAFHIPFNDYTPDELCEIAKLMGTSKGITFATESLCKLKSVFEIAVKNNDFGNGRYVRNTLEQARMNQASRILKIDFDLVSSEDIITIKPEDIEFPQSIEKEIKKIGFAS